MLKRSPGFCPMAVLFYVIIKMMIRDAVSTTYFDKAYLSGVYELIDFAPGDGEKFCDFFNSVVLGVHISPISFLIRYMVRSNGFVLPFLKRLNVPGETFKSKAAFSNVRFFSSKKSLNAILNLSISSVLFICDIIMASQV